jgi:glycerate dehydrogenase
MNKTVFVNAARVDFDKKLDFSPIAKITTFTQFDSSTDDELLQRVQGQHIVITKELPVGRELIMQFPSTVRLIAEAGTGYNNIDLAAAKEKGILVCNVPGYSTEAVAQLVIGFMLDLSSSISRQQVMLRRKDFTNFTHDLSLPHHEVQHKTLGIIAFGTIGRAVAKVAQCLGMQILAFDPAVNPESYPTVRFVSLEELLRSSDFVTIHAPLTPQTRHLINAERLRLMKPTAYLINASRGPIIKETDLIDALNKGVIAGAALDVQEQEPPALDNPLFTMDNVIMTPHIGWKTIESRQRLVNLVAKNIEAFLQGNPINIVNK